MLRKKAYHAMIFFTCVGRIVAITGDCKSPAHRAPLVRVQPGALNIKYPS